MTRAIVLVLALTLLVGCGGGSDISKADFTKKANKICDAGNKKIADIGKSIGANPSADDVKKAVTDKLVPAVQDQIDKIRDLGFPKADKAKLTKIFDDSESALNKIKDDPETALNSGDPFGDINKQLNGYGLTSCGAA